MLYLATGCILVLDCIYNFVRMDLFDASIKDGVDRLASKPFLVRQSQSRKPPSEDGIKTRVPRRILRSLPHTCSEYGLEIG
jgi:hypothetical protein